MIRALGALDTALGGIDTALGALDNVNDGIEDLRKFVGFSKIQFIQV